MCEVFSYLSEHDCAERNKGFLKQNMLLFKIAILHLIVLGKGGEVLSFYFVGLSNKCGKIEGVGFLE